MTGQQVLVDLKRRGYMLWFDGDRLKCRGTVSPITDDIFRALKNNKLELIKLLKAQQPKPYFDNNGDLVIPFGADPVYRWWYGGQSVNKTRVEMKRRQKIN